MKKRYTFTDMELESARKNHGWMGKYYKQLQGATVNKIYVGISDDDPNLAFPIIEFQLASGVTYLSEIVCANETEMPGFITGLPYNE